MAEGSGGSYLDPWTVAILSVGLAVAALCTVAGLRGRAPGRMTVWGTMLVQLVVAVLVLVYLLRTVTGQEPVGPSWELWAYLVTVLFVPALALAWARDEPSRWSTFVLAVAAFTVAVMAARAAQIWHGVGTTAVGGGG